MISIKTSGTFYNIKMKRINTRKIFFKNLAGICWPRSIRVTDEHESTALNTHFIIMLGKWNVAWHVLFFMLKCGLKRLNYSNDITWNVHDQFHFSISLFTTRNKVKWDTLELPGTLFDAWSSFWTSICQSNWPVKIFLQFNSYNFHTLSMI